MISWRYDGNGWNRLDAEILRPASDGKQIEDCMEAIKGSGFEPKFCILLGDEYSSMSLEVYRSTENATFYAMIDFHGTCFNEILIEDLPALFRLIIELEPVLRVINAKDAH